MRWLAWCVGLNTIPRKSLGGSGSNHKIEITQRTNTGRGLRGRAARGPHVRRGRPRPRPRPRRQHLRAPSIGAGAGGGARRGGPGGPPGVFAGRAGRGEVGGWKEREGVDVCIRIRYIECMKTLDPSIYPLRSSIDAQGRGRGGGLRRRRPRCAPGGAGADAAGCGSRWGGAGLIWIGWVVGCLTTDRIELSIDCS